jgi:glycosidase
MKIHLRSLILVPYLLVACTLTTPLAKSTSTPTQPQPATPTALESTQPSQPSETTTPTIEPTSVQAVVPWWNDTVFYEVFVRSFYDTTNDGVGDINGLIEKLDYLNDGDPATTNDLGITGIWLMPITESPSYHGYDVVDYYAVDREYGSREDFTRLIDEAHARGIRVIIDLVLNHTGVDHPWFQASADNDPAYRDWYIWADENPGYPGPWGQQVWIPSGDDFYYAVFWSGMPDFNLENPEVTQEIYNITRFWLEEMNVDGFRMDAIRHFIEFDQAQENTPGTHAWLQAWHTFYKSVDPDAFTVGEAWTDTSQVLDYIGDEVDIAFEFDLAEAFLNAARGPIASALIEQMQVVLDSYPANQYGVFLTNHDQDRVMSNLRGDENKAKLAATMMLTAPGIPFIYYGEEIGMTGTKPDEDIRRPMQWTGDEIGVGFTTDQPWRAPANDYEERNVALQDGDPGSLLNHYRALIHLRNTHQALRTGSAVLVDAGTQRLYALLRYDDEEAFLILVNSHRNPLTADLYSLTLESGPFRGPVQAVSVLGQANPAAPEINAQGGFTGYVPFAEIPAESAVIIQLTP